MKATATEERQRKITRSKALVHLLRERVGETSIYGFAEKYDALVSPIKPTQGQGGNGWQALFNGLRPLSGSRLKSLSAVSVWSDAENLYQDGPADLWRAMWGSPDELRAVVAGELKTWRSFDVTLAEFEADLLLAEIYREPLALQYLAKAIALHRLHHDLLGLDGAGTCRCVRCCLDDEDIREELSGLGVLDAVRADLAVVAGDPLASATADQRWDALETKLDWIS